jgi:exopolysaccharide biosynthesis protein
MPVALSRMGFGPGTALAAVLAAGGVFAASPRAWSVGDLPPRLDRAVAWHPGTNGIEWGEIQLSGDGEAWRTRVILARIDPSRVTLALEPAFAHDGLWTVADADTSVTLAVNAGQFRNSLPWGWVVSGGREVLAPQRAPLAGAVVVDSSGAVRIVPPGEVAAARQRGGIREAFQSYPMLLENGTPPEPLVRTGLGVAVGHRDARLALGTTADGGVVLALTRFDALGPSLGRIPFGFTSAEMATVMRALGCRDAILLDGGISGQLMVREADGAPRSWAGIRSVPLGLVALSKE